jgi:hypothetical protein
MDIIDDQFTNASSVQEEKYLIAYFDRQSDYYLEEYRSYHQGNKFTFNISSFFAGFFWFLYRKLYRQLFICIIVIVAIGFVEGMVLELFQVDEGLSTAFDRIFNIIFALGLGFTGNYFYIGQADKNIKAILSETDNEEERMARLKKVGGTSNVPYYVLAVLVLGIIIFSLLNN